MELDWPHIKKSVYGMEGQVLVLARQTSRKSRNS